MFYLNMKMYRKVLALIKKVFKKFWCLNLNNLNIIIFVKYFCIWITVPFQIMYYFKFQEKWNIQFTSLDVCLYFISSSWFLALGLMLKVREFLHKLFSPVSLTVNFQIISWYYWVYHLILVHILKAKLLKVNCNSMKNFKLR